MNTPNPLMPQGSLPQYPSSGKSTVRIAVFTIVAIHAVFFSGLLMQGCNKRDATTAGVKPGESTNAVNELPKMSNELYYSSVQELPSVPGPASTAANDSGTPLPPQQPVLSAPQSPTGGSQPALPVINPPQVQSMVTDTNKKSGVAPAIETAPGTKEYTIVRGDSFSKIAKANQISVAVLRKANPNVDPEKIQPGQKITIPKAPPVSASAGAEKHSEARTAAPALETNGSSHVVKPGETLSKIAKQHGTTVAAIRALNPKLKTNRLLVGEKVKLPPVGSASSPLTSTNPDRNLPAAIR